MAGHVDTAIVVCAPVAFTWDISTSRDLDPDDTGHVLIARDPRRHAVTLRVCTPPDAEGRTWTYAVERVHDHQRRVVYARRFDNEHFRYANAWWSYQAANDGTLIRCVQDFEMEAASSIKDAEMEKVIRDGTNAALRRTKALVEARLASEHRTDTGLR